MKALESFPGTTLAFNGIGAKPSAWQVETDYTQSSSSIL
jgi:hypothetical protein